MSSLYKREYSPYFWWTARYKGRRLRKSTKMTQKHLAKKVQTEWDLRLVLDNLGFLGLSTHSPLNVTDYFFQYLGFIESRKTVGTWETTRGGYDETMRGMRNQTVRKEEIQIL